MDPICDASDAGVVTVYYRYNFFKSQHHLKHHMIEKTAISDNINGLVTRVRKIKSRIFLFGSAIKKYLHLGSSML